MSLLIEPQQVPLKADLDGVIRVGGTRIGLDVLIDEFLQGATPDDIVQDYPTLTLGDVYSIIAFYLRHRSEVDAYLEQNRCGAQKIRAESERLYPAVGRRERLLARRHYT